MAVLRVRNSQIGVQIVEYLEWSCEMENRQDSAVYVLVIHCSLSWLRGVLLVREDKQASVLRGEFLSLSVFVTGVFIVMPMLRQ